MYADIAISDLLANACASIKYRIKAEIMGQSTLDQEMLELQNQILQDTLVKKVFKWQQPDGWLGWDFHGAVSIETGIRILCEKGVLPQQPVLARTLRALEDYPDRLERGIGKPGKVLDEQGFGGSQMIRAAVFAYAGLEDKPFVKEQVEAALAGFKAVLGVNCINDLVEKYKGKLVFRPGVKWPGIYHLRLLAFTHHWRTTDNQRMVIAAVKKLVELSPLPDIHVRYKSQWIAPASFCMRDFKPDMNTLTNAQWMMWFHRMECLARMCIIHKIPELQQQLNILASMTNTGQNYFTKKLSHPYFTKWGAYTGLMLEPDWRAPIRRIHDLTFRCLLILHYGKERAA